VGFSHAIFIKVSGEIFVLPTDLPTAGSEQESEVTELYWLTVRVIPECLVPSLLGERSFMKL
jgi:hypothetical protein